MPAATPPVGPSSEKSKAMQKVEDLERELELDLENVHLDENVDTSVSGS